MTFYKDERKRMGRGVYAVIAAFLFLHYGEIQSQIPALALRNTEDPVEVIRFVNEPFIWTCIFLPIYLVEKLFFLKERGESVYLISKYTVVPLTKNELYTAKLRILIEDLLLFFLLSIAVYFAVLAANDYWLLSEEVLLKIGNGFVWLVILTVSITLLNVYRGIHMEKAAAF